MFEWIREMDGGHTLWTLSFNLCCSLLCSDALVSFQSQQHKPITAKALIYSIPSLYMWSRNHVIRWHHHYGKGTYSYIALTEREIYNLSLDVVDLLSMAPSFDTHTCSCMKKFNHIWLLVVSCCCNFNPPYSLAQVLQSISS